MKHRFTGDYPPDWGNIAHATKTAARWCCVRSASSAVRPIEGDMTIPTEGNEIRERVGRAVVLNPEVPEGLDMANRQFFGEIIAMLSAVLTPMPGQVSSLVSLLTPVRAVVGIAAAFPVRAVRSSKVLGKPCKTTGVTAEALRRFARTDFPIDPALLTGVGDAVLLAGFRTIATFLCVGRRLEIGTATTRADQSDLRPAPRAFDGAKVLLESARPLTDKVLLASRASLLDLPVFANVGAVSTAFCLRWRTAKRFSTASARQGNWHMGIIPYGSEQSYYA